MQANGSKYKHLQVLSGFFFYLWIKMYFQDKVLLMETIFIQQFAGYFENEFYAQSQVLVE